MLIVQVTGQVLVLHQVVNLKSFDRWIDVLIC